MQAAGLERVGGWISDNTDTSAHPVSVNLEGYRPESVAAEKMLDIKMCAVMSVPRLGWQDHFNCVHEALRPFKMPVRSFTGAFWGQCLQTVIEACVEDGLDWILTLDYDTLFTPQHLDTMMSIFGRHTEIDALAGLQSRRNTDVALMTIKKDGEIQGKAEIDGSPVKVETAHFGFTMIRLDALRDIPKPWFQPKAAPDGTWTHPDHIDSDISFWKKWQAAGKTLYVAPDVRVGHLELMVSEFDEHMNHRHMTVAEWKDEYKLMQETPL